MCGRVATAASGAAALPPLPPPLPLPTATAASSASGASSPPLAVIRLGKRKTRVGTDFSGTEAPIIVMKKRLRIDIDHVFGCDSALCAQKLSAHAFRPAHFYKDVKQRDNPMAPKVDVYMFAPPCQPFSNAGRKQGLNDLKQRGDLAFYALDYIRCRRPRLVISENVANFGTSARFTGLRDVLVSVLEDMQYTVGWQILNTLDYGLPQSRPRFYLIGVQTSSLAAPVEFPPKLSWRVPLSAIIRIKPAADWKSTPDVENDRANVLTHYEKVFQKGGNVFIDPCVIDAKASAAFSSHAVGHSLCLTKTRCEQHGYWISTKGGYMETTEMELLQGFEPDDVPWKEAGLSPAQWAGMLGNGMSLNVLCQVLPFALRSAGMCSSRQLAMMMANAGFPAVGSASRD